MSVYNNGEFLLHQCGMQLYSRGHIKQLGAELSDVDIFARVLKVKDKWFVCGRGIDSSVILLTARQVGKADLYKVGF